MNQEILSIQFLALIHDIDKFYQRAYGSKDKENYTYRFCKEVLGLDEELSAVFTDSECKYAKLIERANCISNEIDSEEDSNYLEDNSVRLKSIFSEIDFGKERKKAYFNLNKIDCSTYPQETVEVENRYKELWDAFEDSVKGICTNGINKYAFDRMYAMLFEYTTLIPDSNLYKDGSFVSLFDHSKLTSAIAGCLLEHQTDSFYMYEFDVSGIQKFIFKVVEGSSTKKGIAKALRGRSSYINLLTNAITYSILDKFDLTESNIIFNTGGGGTILLPFEENIDSILKNVEKPVKEALFEMFGDTITFVSAYVEMNAEELKVFKQEKALTLKMKLDENKSKKYNELFKRDNFFFQMSASQNKCNLCGNEIDDDIERCSTCNAIEHISDFYTKYDKGFVICYDVNDALKEYKDEDLEKIDFKYCQIYLIPKYKMMSIPSHVYIDSINNPELGNVRFLANLVPKNKNGNIMSFGSIVDELTPDTCGDKKMAILKMDVDNLGAVFAFGLKEKKEGSKQMVLQRSLSKYLTLSRSMELFFGKFLVQICKDVTRDIYAMENQSMKNENMFYIDYAGGDDLVIIGPAYGIVYLAKEINETFNQFVKNENMSISGGIFIQDDKSPIRFGVQSAEDLLEESKGLSSKNGITMIHTTIAFNKFDELLQCAQKYKGYINDGVISRTNLYSIMTLIRDKDYADYLRTIPLIQYSLFRNIDKNHSEKREDILKDFNKISSYSNHDELLNQMVLIFKLAIMFTRNS